jgi:hypothetical protein
MFKDDGLLRFVNNMLKSLKAVVVRDADMGRYLDIETIEDDLPDEPPPRSAGRKGRAQAQATAARKRKAAKARST